MRTVTVVYSDVENARQTLEVTMAGSVEAVTDAAVGLVPLNATVERVSVDETDPGVCPAVGGG